MDGTILDTSDFVFSAVEYTLTQHNLTITEEKLSQAKGMPLLDFYKYIFPDQDFELLRKTHHDYQQTRFDLGKLFPGVKKDQPAYQGDPFYRIRHQREGPGDS